MSDERRRATWLLLIYAGLIVAASVLYFAVPPFGAAAMWFVGVPWSMVLILFGWFVIHNYTSTEIFFMHLVLTVPNFVILGRWIAKLYIAEKVEVDA